MLTKAKYCCPVLVVERRMNCLHRQYSFLMFQQGVVVNLEDKIKTIEAKIKKIPTACSYKLAIISSKILSRSW